MQSHSARRAGFTLIELLVVITIIVVLLALLTPALDKAIYQAELAQDGARFKSFANGMLIYAAEYQRKYIYRHNRNYGSRPNILAIHNDPVVDDRPLLSQYISLDVLVDPLAGELKLSLEENPNNAIIYVPTLMFAGWSYDGEQGMNKMGDRFTYTEGFTEDAKASPGALRTRSYNILASDVLWGFADGRQIGLSHPDSDGVTSLVVFQDELPNKSTPAIPIVNQYHTSTSWEAFTNDIGTIDAHFARDDGSVERLLDVERFDERTKPVGLTNVRDDQYANWIPSVD